MAAPCFSFAWSIISVISAFLSPVSQGASLSISRPLSSLDGRSVFIFLLSLFPSLILSSDLALCIAGEGYLTAQPMLSPSGSTSPPRSPQDAHLLLVSAKSLLTLQGSKVGRWVAADRGERLSLGCSTCLSRRHLLDILTSTFYFPSGRVVDSKQLDLVFQRHDFIP